MGAGTNGARPSPPKSASRRSDLPDPFDKYAISEDLTATQRELLAIKARDEARDNRDQEINAKLGILMQDRSTARKVLWAGAAVVATLATTAIGAWIWHAIVGGTKIIIGGGP